jgi:hypothetical protein
VNEQEARAAIAAHFAAAGTDEKAASEIYADDVILDFPQGRERIRGWSNIRDFRASYPAALAFENLRTVGCGTVWADRMAGASDRATFEAFLRAMNTRDSAALDDLLDPDVEETYPQSGERIRGGANIRAIVDHYPSGYEDQGGRRVVGSEDTWQPTPLFTLVHVVGTGDSWTGVQRARYPDGSEWFVVQIARLRSGRIWRLETYFAPTFEAPSWRAPFVASGA